MIVLASTSPRRRELLEMLGVEHTIDPAEIDERPQPAELPETLAVRLARKKAESVAKRRPGDYVLGADTVVVLDGELLGKPTSARHAESMLAKLAGREHKVITAVALARDAQCFQRCDVTRVWLRRMSADFISAYVATGEPLDKAGSYAAQGRGAVLVERIAGDFFGVMGLPLRLVVELMESAGLTYRFTR
ncbi:MAG: Maf family protein [Gemmatimonadales bacterium]